MPTTQEDQCDFGDVSVVYQFSIHRLQGNAIFILVEETTPIDVIDKLIEGTVNRVNWLFIQEKSFLLILTID